MADCCRRPTTAGGPLPDPWLTLSGLAFRGRSRPKADITFDLSGLPLALRLGEGLGLMLLAWP